MKFTLILFAIVYLLGFLLFNFTGRNATISKNTSYEDEKAVALVEHYSWIWPFVLVWYFMDKSIEKYSDSNN